MKPLAAFLALAVPRIFFLVLFLAGRMTIWEEQVGVDIMVVILPNTSIVLVAADIAPWHSVSAGLLFVFLAGLTVDFICYWIVSKAVTGESEQ